VLELMTKELSILGTTKVKDNNMFAQHVIAQDTKAQVAKEGGATERSTSIIQKKGVSLKEMK